MTTSGKKILCIGAGYVGGPTMAMIAAKCPEYRVTVVDINTERIAAWNSEKLPIYEPGLDVLVQSARGRNLFFSTDVQSGIRDADIIFVSVNTPTKKYGEGAGMAADLQYWEKTAREIKANSKGPKIIVEKSTLPVKTALAMEQILKENNSVQFEVLSNPEFLAEGSAIKDLQNPDRVLIGSRETKAGIAARNELVKIYEHWVPREKIITSNIWSSELSKLVANAFLAQRLSSINAISALCEATDAHVGEVANAVGTDSRIGSKFLNASLGFGGSCFEKDILNLSYLARQYNLPEVADYWHSVIRMNTYQKDRFVKRMLAAMFNTLAGKKIALFGFAFKANTGDTRESPAIFVAQKLFEEQAEIIVTDPAALTQAKIDLQRCEGRVAYEADPYKAAKDADAIAVCTEWDAYKTLDYKKIFASMRKPAFIFDGRNILDHESLFKIGFNVYPLGQPELTHLQKTEK